MATDGMRRKILCLGVSYPSIEGQLRSRGLTYETTAAITNVDFVFEKVRDGVFTEMDGRDLARCLQTEQSCNVDVYSVSQERACVYRNDRHLDSNFNRANFVRVLHDKFHCQFDEIILDYFWIPPAWDASHWKPSFFRTTLVEFVNQKILLPRKNQPGEESKQRRNGGVVYLPFCFHCFKETYTSFPILRKHYNLSFVRKKELHKISWWKGTQALDPVRTQQILGKRLDQEEIYCTFGQQHVNGSSESGVSNHELMRILYAVEDFAEIRFLALEPVADGETGSINGLQEWTTIQRGFTRSPMSRKQRKPKKKARATVLPCVKHNVTPSSQHKRERSPDGDVLDEKEKYRPAAKRQLFKAYSEYSS